MWKLYPVDVPGWRCCCLFYQWIVYLFHMFYDFDADTIDRLMHKKEETEREDKNEQASSFSLFLVCSSHMVDNCLIIFFNSFSPYDFDIWNKKLGCEVSIERDRLNQWRMYKEKWIIENKNNFVIYCNNVIVIILRSN